MNKILNRILLGLRERYKLIYAPKLGLKKSEILVNLKGQQVSDLIISKINLGEPFLVSRFGSEELRWYRNYKFLSKNFFKRAWNYISCNIDFWEKKYRIIDNLTFKPTDLPTTNFFINKMDMAIPEIDLLGSWLSSENSKYVKFNKNINFSFLLDLEPFWHDVPWSSALKGKRVLIIHPMVDSIKEQLSKRNKLFENKLMIPDFETEYIQAKYFDDPKFNTWKAIYEFYINEVKNYQFDIAIIGCGSWGMPIAAEIKQMGKQVIHLGGASQLLFGIMGNRWISGIYEGSGYKNLMNEHWVKPKQAETPEWTENFEHGSPYW